MSERAGYQPYFYQLTIATILFDRKRSNTEALSMKRATAGLYQSVLTAALLLTISLPRPALNAPLGEQETARLVAEAPGADKYPDAGALILYQEKNVSVAEDNTQVLEEQLLVKILKDRGRRFGDQKRMFDARTDSVEVLRARTWLPGGQTVPVEAKAINVITPPELTGAAIYADIKQKVISFGSIAPGVVIELVTRTISRPDTSAPLNLYPYWDVEVFRSDEPILEKIYDLEIPADFPEPRLFTGGDLEIAQDSAGQESEGPKAKHYRWEVRDEPMIHRIPYMPGTLAFAPFLLYSNVDSWEKLGSWLGAQFYPKAQPDAAIRAKVAELTAGSKTPADTVREIYLFVTTQVRNISLQLGLAGYAPTEAAKVFQNMYGHELDKAALLSAMLTAAGFENYPALSRADQVDLLEPSIPSAAQFSRVSIYVPGLFTDSTFANPLYPQTERHGLWLMPIAQYNRYAYYSRGQGARALVILPCGGTLCRIQEFPPEKSLSYSNASLELDAEGNLTGQFKTVTDGLFDAQARLALKDLTPRELEQFFRQATNSVGEGAEMQSDSLSDLRDLTAPASAGLSFSAPEVGVVQGEMMIVRLPQAPFEFAGLPYFPELKEREFDFVADGPFVLASEISLGLPEGWTVAYSPEDLSRSSQFGRWNIDCSISGGRLNFSRRLMLTSRQVKTYDYPDFKKFCESFTLPRYSLLLLEKKAAPGK